MILHVGSVDDIGPFLAQKVIGIKIWTKVCIRVYHLEMKKSFVVFLRLIRFIYIHIKC